MSNVDCLTGKTGGSPNRLDTLPPGRIPSKPMVSPIDAVYHAPACMKAIRVSTRFFGVGIGIAIGIGIDFDTDTDGWGFIVLFSKQSLMRLARTQCRMKMIFAWRLGVLALDFLAQGRKDAKVYFRSRVHRPALQPLRATRASAGL